MPEYNIKGGVHCAEFFGGDQKNVTYGFSGKDVENIIQKMLECIAFGASLIRQTDGSLRADWDGKSLSFQPRAAYLLSGQRSERSYLLSLTLHKDYLEWSTNFIPLRADVMERKTAGGALDIPLAYLAVHTPPPGSGPEAQITTEPLENITEAVDRHDAFVILGEPGCGKTTTLQKMAYDHAIECLRDQTGKLPFFVRLSQQRSDSPFSFLEKIWTQHTGTSLADALAAGRMLLLLDGVNELPRDDTLTKRLNDWRLFAEEYGGKNKIVFSGREKDYSGHLDLPRVLVRSLDDGQINDYLHHNQAEGLLDALQSASPDAQRRMMDLAQNPLHLNMLVHYYRENQTSLDNRGALFAWFANALIAREKYYHSENDPENIPVEVRAATLARLAFAMQDERLGTVIALQKAQGMLPPRILFKGKTHSVNAEEFFTFAKGARVFDPHMDEEVRFQHQMLHEYFAGVDLLRRFDAGENLERLWLAKRTVDDMPPADVGEWDPLPEPPTTGWEVTTILACGLSSDPAKLIEAVRKHNPILAGRCLDEAGIRSPLPSGEGQGEGQTEVRERVQQDLLADLYNPAMHLRTRLQAGFVLGRIGDPRFQPQEIPPHTGTGGVKVILPQMVNVPAGTYLIGSKNGEEDSFNSEYPQHPVELDAFSIGKWSVTNAEFACFMEAGGYENKAYWQGDLAKRWLQGEDVSGGQFKSYFDVWNALKSFEDVRATLEQTKNFTPDDIDFYESIAKMSEEELKAYLGKNLSQKSRTQPQYWKDRERNNPSQPVVGITWFEASAYCAWLAEMTGKQYRLPTEMEWEAAARGLPEKSLLGKLTARKYPWSDEWDNEKANSIEGRVMKPSPVGAYAAAGAVGPFDAEDQAGNVYDWTSSVYLPYPYDAEKSEQAESDAERVVRGGSWDVNRWYVRCAYRDGYIPGSFNDDIGFRFISPGSDSSAS